MKFGRKKVGTMTFHMAHNYGAMLQAYALPAAVKKLGCHCEVIDYRFPYIDRWARMERLPELVERCGLVGGYLRYGKRLLNGTYRKRTMQTKFSAFEQEIIPTSKRIYRSKEALHDLPYDAILFGSDQIWNSALIDGVAEEYVGGFPCLPHTKKIAYAASCGKEDFQLESRQIYEEHIKSFSAISVREQAFRDTLVSRGFEAECVLDPTLLLCAEEWKRCIPRKLRKTDGKYLLVYAFDEDERLYDAIRAFAAERELEIIAIAYQKKDSMHHMDVRTDCGPLEFLSLFANAQHVVTTSFHGTVFSVIFHKNFHCVPHPLYRERTDSLLKLLKLENHSAEQIDVLQEPAVDWARTDAILERERNRAYGFLKNALGLDG